MILEDEVQRITLIGDPPSHDLVTGVVMACLGRDNHNGCFHVNEYCFAGGALSVERPLVTMETDNKDNKYEPSIIVSLQAFLVTRVLFANH